MYNSHPCLVDSCLAPGSCVLSAPSPTVFSDPWREYRWSHLWPSARSRLWLALSRAVRQSLRLSLYPLQSEASQTKVGRAPVDGQTHLDGSPVKGSFRKKTKQNPRTIHRFFLFFYYPRFTVIRYELPPAEQGSEAVKRAVLPLLQPWIPLPGGWLPQPEGPARNWEHWYPLSPAACLAPSSTVWAGQEWCPVSCNQSIWSSGGSCVILGVQGPVWPITVR